MQLKASIALLITLALLTSAKPIAIADGRDSVNFLFAKKFQTLKVKNKLKIVRTDINTDDFFVSLRGCVPDFYKGTVGLRSYGVTDKAKINRIAVSEYIFRNPAVADKAYRIAYAYAESVRKKMRKDFDKLCLSIPEFIHYASKDGMHVYLYVIDYNFQYYNQGQDSMDTNMQKDKRILLDDLYKEMTGQ